MKILVSFSGGKDSQACLIQAFKQYGGGNLTAVFCDTGWEHPDTYKHVNDVCLQMGVKLITLKSKYDFVSLAAHKKRFPSTNARFCTSELKMKPMIDYVLSLKESCIIIQGIRAGESTARAAMEEECMYFKSYFQLDFWNYPTLLEYDNTMFSDTVVISYKSTRKEDGIESIPLVFFFCVSDLSYHYHRENVTEKWYGERLKIKAIKFLIEKGYDVPIY